ncbi:MAG: AAA family ATPase [Terriglobia bacterium]
MARADLLLTLVKAGRALPDPRFRSAVEALIAEERAKKHEILADELTAAYYNRPNGVPAPAVTMSTHLSSINDLIFEVNSDRALESLILPQQVTEECRDLIEEQHRADLLRSYNLVPRNRVLLVGPPGNGKTSLAHAIAHDLMAPLLMVRYDGLIGSYLGETAIRLRKIFDHARQRPCVLFFDEFDTIGKERGDIHETGEIKRVVSTLLLQVDQLPAYVVIVTATNHAELLDRAVWRRFQLRLNLPMPKPEQIEQFLGNLLGGFEGATGLSAHGLSKDLHGATYSDVEELYFDFARRAVLAGPGADFSKLLTGRISAWKGRASPAGTRRVK